MHFPRPLLACLVLLVVVAVGGGGAAADADAAGPFKGSQPPIARLPLPPGSRLVGDDDQQRLLLVVGPSEPSDYRIFDLVTGTLTPLALPRPGCQVVAGHGALVALCGYDLSLTSLFERGFTDDAWVPIPVQPGGDPDVLLDDVGTHWIGFHTEPPKGAGTAYLLSRSPDHAMIERVTEDPHQLVDLNRPTGRVTLCAPLRRPLGVWSKGFSFRSFAYSAPWGVEYASPRDHGALEVHRCGTGDVTRVCRSACNGWRLTGHRLSWHRKGRDYLRDLARGRTTEITVPHQRAEPVVVGEHVVIVASSSAKTNRDLGIVVGKP